MSAIDVFFVLLLHSAFSIDYHWSLCPSSGQSAGALSSTCWSLSVSSVASCERLHAIFDPNHADWVTSALAAWVKEAVKINKSGGAATPWRILGLAMQATASCWTGRSPPRNTKHGPGGRWGATGGTCLTTRSTGSKLIPPIHKHRFSLWAEGHR